MKMSINLNEMKHPLENEWSFWLYTNKEKNWEDNLVELTTFKTVEDFWCLYHHMKLPSELNIGQDYAIFKTGIRPMWEDDTNKNGGRWQIIFESLKGSTVDSIWIDTVLLLLGETCIHSDTICGVFVNVRNKNKIGIWTSNSNDVKAILEVGKKLRQLLRVPNKIQYYRHNTGKCLFTV